MISQLCLQIFQALDEIDDDRRADDVHPRSRCSRSIRRNLSPPYP